MALGTALPVLLIAVILVSVLVGSTVPTNLVHELPAKAWTAELSQSSRLDQLESSIANVRKMLDGVAETTTTQTPAAFDNNFMKLETGADGEDEAADGPTGFSRKLGAANRRRRRRQREKAADGTPTPTPQGSNLTTVTDPTCHASEHTGYAGDGVRRPPSRRLSNDLALASPTTLPAAHLLRLNTSTGGGVGARQTRLPPSRRCNLLQGLPSSQCSLRPTQRARQELVALSAGDALRE